MASLAPGTRLGPYEILAALGAGGMGEVYRAHDAKLNRDVAIKVLLPAVANDPDRLARFSREAQVLASLNHPNIAHIHGIEEAGGVTALVLELVEGEDLAQRIAQGAIPLDEALPIAKQIAEALEAAHEQGIIHRDLKPANIKVRPDGTVKVLDFGLAKAMDPAGTSSANAMNSPTLSMHATQAGIILGTAAYMAPEQAKGKAVDARADIWAFGAVLYEMLAGTRAFAGEDISDTMVAVLSKAPDWTRLPGGTPPRVRDLLRRCLERDAKRRLQAIGEARIQLDDLLSRKSDLALPTDPAPVSAPRVSLVTASTLGAALVTVTALITWMLMRASPLTSPSLMRFAIVPPPAQPLSLTNAGADRDLALSRDGTSLVYRAGPAGGQTQLVLRRLDQLETQALLSGLSSGGNAVRHPFFSPDGHWIGFFDGGELKKVSITGGPAVTLCKATGNSRGASWGDDDTIVFATTATTGLMRVSAGGGEPKALTTSDATQHEGSHWFPSVLPGNRGVLFTISSGQAETAQVVVLDLKTGQRKTLVRGSSNAEYVDPSRDSGQAGYLVYGAASTLRAVRFDLARLDILGDPVPVVEHVTMGGGGAADFVVSRSGTLAYVPGGGAATQRQLVWVDRKGHEEPIKAPPRAYIIPRLSPDGTRVALQILDQENDIWTWDLTRQTLTRFTFDPGVDQLPVWTPDGRRIIFSSTRTGAANVFWHAADGTGADQRLTTSVNAQYPTSVTPDGTHILGYEFVPRNSFDAVRFAWDGASSARTAGAPADSVGRPSEPLVQTTSSETNVEVSPDGRYFAYQSNESGKDEVYVRPYPKVNDGRWQVSTGGGSRPAWARNGRELFFLDGAGTLAAVPVQTAGVTFSPGNPANVFDTKYAVPVAPRTYDVSPDGRRFLMIKDGTTDGNAPLPRMIVVLNWIEELKAKLPAK